MATSVLYQWAVAAAIACGYGVRQLGEDLGLFVPSVIQAAEDVPLETVGDAEDVLSWLRWNGADVDAYRPQGEDHDDDCDGVDYDDDCDGPSAA